MWADSLLARSLELSSLLCNAHLEPDSAASYCPHLAIGARKHTHTTHAHSLTTHASKYARQGLKNSLV